MKITKTGIAAVGTALMVGLSPMTAFAYYDAEAADDVVEVVEEYEIDEDSEEISEEEYGPLTPDGNMELVDDYGSIEVGGKQFITVTSKSGNYFYIIIDRDDNGNETVHFLNQVDEADLLALMDDETKEEFEAVKEEKAEEEKVVVEKEDTTVENAEKVKSGHSNITGIMAIVLVVTVAGIVGFFYFKKNKKQKTKKTDGPDPDLDYLEEDYIDSLVQGDTDEAAEGDQE